jgi:hypothetical protein
MATTTVPDAVVFPQSTGTGLASNADQADAILFSALAQYQGGEYVNTRLLSGIPFSNHDGTNDTVDVGPGVCYLRDNSSSTSNDRDGSGDPQGESSTSSGFDFSFADHHYVVVLPTAVTISVSNGTLNGVYIDVDPTSNNSVSIEHDGSSAASPGATTLKIGETNPDDATADTRANDDPALRARSVGTDTATVNGTPENDPRELVSHVTQSGDGSSDLTASVSINSLKDDDYVIIEANKIRDDSGSGELQLEFSSGSDGDYDFTKRDGSGNYTTVNNPNQYTLVNFTGGNSDVARGIWTYGDGGREGRIGLMGQGMNTNRSTSFEALVHSNGVCGITSSDPTLEFTLTSNGATLQLDMSAFRVQQRSTI